MKYIGIILYCLIFTFDCASQDTCKNVLRSKNSYGFTIFTIKGDKQCNYPPAGTWTHDPNQRDVMTKQEDQLLKSTITNSFDEKQFNKLKNADERIMVSIWDSLGQVVSAEYKSIKKDKSAITICDIWFLDIKLKQLIITIPPAYKSYKIFNHQYFYIFSRNEWEEISKN